MRILTAIALLCLTATSAIAATPGYISFQPYSSATKVQCGVFGHSSNRDKDGAGNVIQGLVPTPDKSRMLTLNTKTMVNYSTNGTRAVSFTCTTLGATTAALVKVYLNKVTTFFQTLSSGTFFIAQ